MALNPPKRTAKLEKYKHETAEQRAERTTQLAERKEQEKKKHRQQRRRNVVNERNVVNGSNFSWSNFVSSRRNVGSSMRRLSNYVTRNVVSSRRRNIGLFLRRQMLYIETIQYIVTSKN